MIALDELKTINTQLLNELSINSPINPNKSGNLHMIIQDYLIIRTTGLFDKISCTVSFENLYKGNSKYETIKQEDVIQYLIKMRHNFVAHSNEEVKHGYPETYKVINSNLSELLERLIQLL